MWPAKKTHSRVFSRAATSQQNLRSEANSKFIHIPTPMKSRRNVTFTIWSGPLVFIMSPVSKRRTMRTTSRKQNHIQGTSITALSHTGWGCQIYWKDALLKYQKYQPVYYTSFSIWVEIFHGNNIGSKISNTWFSDCFSEFFKCFFFKCPDGSPKMLWSLAFCTRDWTSTWIRFYYPFKSIIVLSPGPSVKIFISMS